MGFLHGPWQRSGFKYIFAGMDALKHAIDKAMAQQYPNGDTPAFITFNKDVKKSDRARWSDHFKLQLMSNGFKIVEPNHVFNGNDAYDVFPEYKFHPTRKWSMDYAIPFLKISIEIEGGIWMKGGAHSLPSNIQRDIEKQNAAVLLGWRPLRFSPMEIKSGTSIQTFLALHQYLLEK